MRGLCSVWSRDSVRVAGTAASPRWDTPVVVQIPCPADWARAGLAVCLKRVFVSPGILCSLSCRYVSFCVLGIR